MMDVILSEAKNLACARQMFRLRLNMTTPQIISDRALVFARSLRKFLRCCAPDFAQWDFTADWTSGFDFAQIVRGPSRRTN
jgi:hypothetical protein